MTSFSPSPLCIISMSCILALTACADHSNIDHTVGKTFENYQMPTAYANLDSTPISSPHGYNKTQDDEDAARDKIAAHADGWKGAVLNALTPISSVLDMSQPVAVVAAPPLTPLNSAAANYAREVMIGMNYLTALPADTTQLIHVDGNRIGKPEDEMVQFKLSIERDGITYASRTIEVKMKPQEAEESLLPTWPHLDNPVVPVAPPTSAVAPMATTPAPLPDVMPAQTTAATPEPTSPVPPEHHPRGLAKPLYGQ